MKQWCALYVFLYSYSYGTVCWSGNNFPWQMSCEMTCFKDYGYFWNLIGAWGDVAGLFVNSFSLGQHQAIIWTNAGILIIGTLRTNFSEILSESHTFLFKKMLLKILSVKWWKFCFRLNALTYLVWEYFLDNLPDFSDLRYFKNGVLCCQYLNFDIE